MMLPGMQKNTPESSETRPDAIDRKIRRFEICKKPDGAGVLTLAVLVVWIFQGVRGGGAFLRPPRLTRLLSYVATCGRRRSKARPKSLTKYFGNF